MSDSLWVYNMLHITCYTIACSMIRNSASHRETAFTLLDGSLVWKTACALLVTISANRSSNGQSKEGLSCIVRVHRFNLQVCSKGYSQTRLSFVYPKRGAPSSSAIAYSRRAESTMAMNRTRKRYGLLEGRNTHPIGRLLYRRTLSGFRVAERKHFSSLPPPPSRRASRSISRRKAPPCFQN